MNEEETQHKKYIGRRLPPTKEKGQDAGETARGEPDELMLGLAGRKQEDGGSALLNPPAP